MVWSQIKPNFFACLSFCGLAQIGVTRFNSTAGKGDISGPRVALYVGALDKEQLRAFTFLQYRGDGAAWGVVSDRSVRGECAMDVVEGVHWVKRPKALPRVEPSAA